MKNISVNRKFLSISAILFLFLALFWRIEYEYTFFPNHVDSTAQINAAQNYKNGDGLTECQVRTADVSRVVCEEQTWWAIGVPVLLALAANFTDNFLQAEFLLRCVGLMLFFTAVFLIYNFLPEKVALVSFCLFCVFYAFQYPQYGFSFTSDILALTFFLLAAACSFYIVFSVDNFFATILLAVLCAFFLYLTGFVRYAYYPVIPIVPLTVLLAAFLKDRRRLLTAAATVGVAIVLFFALNEMIFPGHFAANAYVKQNAGGFYPESLLLFDPFVFKAFFPWDLFVSRVAEFSNFAALAASLIIGVITFALLAPIFVGSFWDFRRYSKIEFSPIVYLRLLTLTTLCLNVGALVYLTVKTAKMFEGDMWMFVASTRYFLPSIVLIQINIFYYIASLTGKSNWLKKLIAAFVFFAFLTHLAIFAAFRYKVYVKKDSNSTFVARLEAQKLVDAEMNKIAEDEKKPVVLVAHWGTEPIGRENYLSSLDFYIFNDEINASQPTVLLLRLPKNLKTIEKNFLNSHNGQKLFEVDGFDLYRTDVLPKN